MTPRAVSSQRTQTLQIIWTAITSSTVVYWLLGLSLLEPFPQPRPSSMVTALMVVLSASTLATAWALYRQHIGAIETQLTPTALQQLGPVERMALAGRVQWGAIICLVLLETPALYGLASGLAHVTSVALLTLLALTSLLACLAFRMLAVQNRRRLLDRLEAATFSSPPT